MNKCDCQNSFLLLLRGEFFLWQGDFIVTYNFLNYNKSFKEFGRPTGKKSITHNLTRNVLLNEKLLFIFLKNFLKWSILNLSSCHHSAHFHTKLQEIGW